MGREWPACHGVDCAKAEPAFGLLARALANQGRLHEAIDCCNRWIAADKVNLGSHYLRAVILQERGAIDEAVQSFRTALYLDPRFVLAHFALGNIARDRGHVAEARKHLENAAEDYRPLFGPMRSCRNRKV